MLKLNDGRNELWQWDTGRSISVDADCSQVHFGRNVYGRSIDVDVVDGIAKVPDVLLQIDKPITAWAFVGTPGNGYTKISKEFVVNKRNKPADYVFTQEEQITLRDVIKRLEDVEENQNPEAIAKIVNDYLEENPVESPVQSVNGKTGKVHLNADDVGALPKTTKIPKEYVLPLATSDTLGGVKAEPATEADTQPVRIGADGMLFTVPGGGGEKWETIIDYTVPEDCSQVLLTTDINGNPFSLKKAVAYFVLHPIADPSAATAIRYAFDSSVGAALYNKQHFWGAAEAPKNAGKATACRFELTKTNEGVIATVRAASGEFAIGTEDVQLKTYACCERFHQGTLITYATGIDAVGVGSYKTAVGAGTRIKLLGVRE